MEENHNGYYDDVTIGAIVKDESIEYEKKLNIHVGVLGMKLFDNHNLEEIKKELWAQTDRVEEFASRIYVLEEQQASINEAFTQEMQQNRLLLKIRWGEAIYIMTI